MNNKPLATIAFVFRERLSPTVSCLQHLIDTTPAPYELICVDAGAPKSISASLRLLASKHGFTLIRSEAYLSPNQSRNLALEHVQTRYVVFVDNDVTVGPDWLDALVQCAEETGAWLVAPLYLESHKRELKIHMFGGVIRVRDEDGRPALLEKHNFAHEPLNGESHKLVRQPTELTEFHTLLMHMDAYRSLGPLDEKLLNMAEHSDLCLAVRNAGKQIYLEPSSVITYRIPDRLDAIDKEFFALRWSEGWTQATLKRLAEKYSLPLEDRGLSGYGWFVRFHRQRVMAAYPHIRNWFGTKWHARFLERIGQPLEKWWNLRKYSLSEYVTNNRVEARVISGQK